MDNTNFIILQSTLFLIAFVVTNSWLMALLSGLWLATYPLAYNWDKQENEYEIQKLLMIQEASRETVRRKRLSTKDRR